MMYMPIIFGGNGVNRKGRSDEIGCEICCEICCEIGCAKGNGRVKEICLVDKT